MTDVIHISWDSGYMDVAVGQFFPTNLSKTRKVFKLLLDDPDWTTDKVEELLAYFATRQQDTAEKAKRLQLFADQQMKTAEALKEKKPKRNSPEYDEYVKEKTKAYQMNVTARATAREAEGLRKTRLLLAEMDGRSV